MFADRPVRTLCMIRAHAGCRLSEALALSADRVDLAAGVLTIESLKKRRTGIFRNVPVPPALLDALDMVHGIREAQSRRSKGRGERLWPWSRMTGWRAVHTVVAAAGLDGPHASPKGLRHGFGVAAVSAGIPLNLVQKWLGHAQLSTTAILCQCGWRRGEGYCSAHVAVRSGCYERRDAWHRQNQKIMAGSGYGTQAEQRLYHGQKGVLLSHDESLRAQS
jgi:site-specific recombinase XerC